MIKELCVRYFDEMDYLGKTIPARVESTYIRLLKESPKGDYAKGLMLVGNNKQHPVRLDVYDAQKESHQWKPFNELPQRLKEDFLEDFRFVETKNKTYNEIREYLEGLNT